MFSLVIPVFKNEESLGELLTCLVGLDGELGHELEAVFVVDGSPDRSLELLRDRLSDVSFGCQVLSLSRNFGSFAAIMAGLEHAQGPHFGVMAADLQEPPELILRFREVLATGDYDVVVGRRVGRQDPWASRLASALFWGIYRRLVQREVPPGGVDVFACNEPVRDQLVALRELHTTLIGLLFWVGFRRTEISYVRRVRRHGRSSWSLSRRLRYLLDSVFGFSDLPVRLLGLAGGAGMLLALLLGTVVAVARLLGGIEVPGYAATILVVVFFGGLNAFGLGLLGEYLWRTFENTKVRPPYIVARRWRFSASGGGCDESTGSS